LVAAFVVAVLCPDQGRTDEQDCGNIKILGGVGNQKDKVYLEPEVIQIEKGGCVSWINQFEAENLKPDILLIFEDEKQCVDISASGTYEFYLKCCLVAGAAIVPFIPEDCYVTYWIPYGETSGIRFLEIGTYEYIVEVEEERKAEGKIVVR